MLPVRSRFRRASVEPLSISLCTHQHVAGSPSRVTDSRGMARIGRAKPKDRLPCNLKRDVLLRSNRDRVSVRDTGL